MIPTIYPNISLRPYNSFGLSVSANEFTILNTENQLKALLKSEEFQNKKSLVLGGGSNMLFTKNYKGLILFNCFKGISIIKEDNNFIWLKVASGENWHQVVRYTVSKNWGGLENLSLIPGSIGAAPIQNIGAYGVELKDSLTKVEAYFLKSGERLELTNEECNFAYRDSIFKNELKGQLFITNVEFKLKKKLELNTSYGKIEEEFNKALVSGAIPSVRLLSNIVSDIRRTKLPDPSIWGNGGSFFKNPVISKEVFLKLKDKYPLIPSYPNESGVKVPAGWLIEQCGWKGKKVGETGTYKNQALVLINYGAAKGKDIAELAKKIEADVSKTFAILLEREINWI